MLSDCFAAGLGFYKVLSYFINAAVILFSMNYSIEDGDSVREFWRKALALIGISCALWSIVQAFVLYSGSLSGFVYRQYRISGYIMDATSTATIMAIAMVCCIAIYKDKHTKIHGFITKPIGLAVCIAVLFVAGLLTGTRAFLYYMVVVALYVMRRARWYYKGLLVVICVIGFVLLFTYVSESGIDIMDTDRSEKWKDAINIFTENPIFGIGTNRYAIWKYHGTRATNIHNVLFQTAAEGGVVGLIFLLMWWGNCLAYVTRGQNKSHKEFVYIFFLMLLFSQLEGVLGHEHLFTLWVIITRAISLPDTYVV